jgi:DNA-binding MarR family transcriptional regulator
MAAPSTRKNATEEVGTIGSLLRLSYQALSRRLYSELAKTYPEVRPAHGAVLRHLPPGGMRVTDLAECAQMTKQSMGYLVENLQSAGYVCLVPDPSDGRAKLVQFTEKGEECLALALSLTAKIESEASSRMAPGQMEQIRALLLQLGIALDGVIS